MSKAESARSIDRSEDSPKVLVVDDDDDLADTYAFWLSDRFDVETAYSGAQARKKLDDDLDIVLLDRRMPGIPGDTVLEHIRELGVDCQVAMLTAVEPDTDIIDLPFDEYLVKPVSRNELREAVDSLLLRAGFESEAQEYLAMESKFEALAKRDEENLGEPEAAAQLQSDTERARESERIQDLKARLDRLKRITSVIRDIDKQLVVATSREEIERTTCERLVNADPYELAWVGDYTTSFDQMTPRVMAGDDDIALEDTVAADGGGGPIAEAVSTETVRVVDDIAAGNGPTMPQPIRGGDAERNFTAGAVVPLVYRDTVYGVLNVYTDAEDVFDEREVAVLSELGDSIANAINDVESKNLMLSDTVVELEFAVRDGTDVFVGLSELTGSRIELKGFVPAAGGELTGYLEVTGATTKDFLDTAIETDDIRRIRGLGESDEVRLYECRVASSTVVLSLIEAGANVRSMVVDEGEGHITAAVAPETDVRTVVETIGGTFDDVDLLAKRRTERDLQSTEDFRTSLENRLTDRQYSVLQASYSAGYFDWPRGSTAKEIAESLDLAPPTLHEHLRGAHNELVGLFFDETGDVDDASRLRHDGE